MSEQRRGSRSNRRRWIIGTAAVLLLVLLGGGVGYFMAGRKVYTDDRDIRLPAHLVNLREVLWSPPEPLGEQFNSPEPEFEPTISPDGAELYFVRGLPKEDRTTRSKIYVSYRRNNVWTEPALVQSIASDANEMGPRLSHDGELLFFYSNRAGGEGAYDIWAAKRTDDGWGEPFNLGPQINSPYNEYGPAMTPDGKKLYFASNRVAAADSPSGTPQWGATIRETGRERFDHDLFVADAFDNDEESAQSAPLHFGQAQPLHDLNTPYDEGSPCVSPRGDFLYFSSKRPGGQGGIDLYRVRIRQDSYQDLENLGPEVNTPFNEADPQLAANGFRIYFSSDRGSETATPNWNLYTAESFEVFVERERLGTPALGWSWWLLLAALALLLPLLMFLRDGTSDRLNTLQKCLLLSLIAHLLMTVLFSFVMITQEIVEIIKHEAGMEVAVNLSESQEVEMRLETRQQATDLPASEPMPQQLTRAQTQVQPETFQQPQPLNVPQSQVRPAAFDVQVETPKNIPPTPTDRVELPKPKVQSDVPVLELQPMQRVAEAETTPQANTPQPLQNQRQQNQAQPTNTQPQQVALQAAPARPETPSLVQPAQTAAATPDAQQVTEPLKVQVTTTDLQLQAPQISAARVQSAEAEAPPTANPVKAVSQARADAPEVLPDATVQNIALNATPTQPTTDSFARAVEAARPTPDARIIIEAPQITFDVQPELPTPQLNTPTPTKAQTTEAPVVADATNPTTVQQPQQEVQTNVAAAAAQSVKLTAQASTATANTQLVTRAADTAKLVPQVEFVTPQIETTVDGQPNLTEPQVLVSATQLRRESSSAPSVTEDQPLSQQVATASPDGEASDVEVAVPASRYTPDSLAVSVTFNPRSAPADTSLAIDLPKHLADTPEVTLPTTTARLQSATEETPVGRPDEGLRTQSQQFASAQPVERPTDVLRPGQLEAAVDRTFESLLQKTSLNAYETRIAETAVDHERRRPLVDSLSGVKLGPGDLEAPESLFQRSIAQRKKMIKDFGGDEQSEAAVDRALAYLARNQEVDGRWTFIGNNDSRGPGKRGRNTHDVALTGLGALCFLGADHTPGKPGPYRETVTNAIEFLVANQKSNGDLRSHKGGRADMYSHGIAALAIAEAALMTRDPRYRDAAFRASEFIFKAQHKDSGGWRYSPGEFGDTSVFGWQIMAISSAEQSGLTIPKKVRDGADRWLAHVTRKGTLLAGYQSPSPKPAMAAEAMFCRILLGEQFEEKMVDQACEYFLQYPAGKGNNNYYYWYYASLAMMQLQNEHWDKWNTRTRDYLKKKQRRGGDFDGSWDDNGEWANRGGRVFSTAMACLTLEVYYRYLPMYQGDGDE